MLEIKIPKPKNVHSLFSTVKKDAEEKNISWTGDIHSGHGESRGFECSYVVDGDYVTITVTKKPPWVTKAKIEKEIKKYFSDEAVPD